MFCNSTCELTLNKVSYIDPPVSLFSKVLGAIEVIILLLLLN